MRALVLLLLGGCFVASPVMTFGGGKSAKQAQHDQASQLTPPVLVALDEGWTSQVAVAKIRVWADDDFRAQNVHWQQTFAEQLAYANEVLAPLLGVTLEADYRDWHPELPPDASLRDKLAALGQHDPGNDVLAVVGLTSALTLVSATFDELGVATLSGRHLMLRGYADGHERPLFDRAFPKLSPAERDALYRARRRHKTTATLLHELAHNLGVAHEDIPDTLMNASYSTKAAAFTPEARDTMLATLDARLGRKPSVKAAAPKDTHPRLVITVSATGERSIGGNVVDDATLDELMKMSVADDPLTQIVVRAARSTPHGAVTRVLQQAKAAGLSRVAIEVGSDVGP